MNCSSDDSLEYSSSDVEDDTVNFARQTLKRHAAVACMIGMYYEVTFLQDKRRPVHTEEGDSGYDWTIRTLKDPTECYNMFIMSRELFYELHDFLRSKYGLKSSENMCTLESLAMFLWMVGAPQSFRQAKNRFRRSLETVSRRFDDVLESVYRLFVDIIKVKDPTYSTIHPKLQEARFSPHFDNCIGAIDGTNIPVQVPAAKVLQYVGRHGYSSQNVLVICDFDMRFTFVVAGWPGSVRDMRVFNDGLNKYGDKFPHPPLGKFYLVDSGYPNRKGYLASYKGMKYHLPEFRQGPRLEGSKELFNYYHSSLRNVIERSFGVLKMKWRILLAIPTYPLEKQSKIILACMALHNFIQESALSDQEFDKCDEDENYMPMPPENHPRQSCDSTQDTDMNAFRDSIL